MYATWTDDHRKEDTSLLFFNHLSTLVSNEAHFKLASEIKHKN